MLRPRYTVSPPPYHSVPLRMSRPVSEERSHSPPAGMLVVFIEDEGGEDD